MGSIDKVLSTVKFHDSSFAFFDIETNFSSERLPNIIHLQNEAMRIEMTIEEFLVFAHAVLKAGEKLRKLKGLDFDGTNNKG